ncbi:hypothetical protein D7241_10020 [Stutzerimonas sp. VN223-3]|uniref:curli-like amyloid fiber formation chaperone CsgH n=1 Tax=Stutzerimonas sp. VN223-3 TaxID=3384601 RepID=UPI0038B45643
MLSAVTLASLLLASGALPVAARLELTPEGNDRLALRLCFSSPQAHNLSYSLEVRTSGKAGTSRSRHSGALVSGPAAQCPLNNRLGLSADSRVDATLEWSIDGQPQPPLQQSYPAARPASPEAAPDEPPPMELELQPIEQPHEAPELIAGTVPPAVPVSDLR